MIIFKCKRGCLFMLSYKFQSNTVKHVLCTLIRLSSISLYFLWGELTIGLNSTFHKYYQSNYFEIIKRADQMCNKLVYFSLLNYRQGNSTYHLRLPEGGWVKNKRMCFNQLSFLKFFVGCFWLNSIFSWQF